MVFDGLSEVVSPAKELNPETLKVYGSGEEVPLW